MNQLFSEIYGCYYGIVARILNHASDNISQHDIDTIIENHGFCETAFHILPSLIDGKWNFLKKCDNHCSSLFSTPINRPLTNVELSWLKAIVQDPRIKLFLDDDKLVSLDSVLSTITPAFYNNDFVNVDIHLDGDHYTDRTYINNFRTIVNACKSTSPLSISYDNGKPSPTQRIYYPFKLSYSFLNDKFRLLCATFNPRTNKLCKVTLNLQKISSAVLSDEPYDVSLSTLHALYATPAKNPPITVEITKERNSLERFLLQFASFDRYTEYDAERDLYICNISYDSLDETELLIRILSFGPTVKVIAPQSFLAQLKHRLARQIELLNTPR